MKKTYTNPELIITSFEAEDIMKVSTVNNYQTTFNTKNYSEIEF